jgi:hypothetical protein
LRAFSRQRSLADARTGESGATESGATESGATDPDEYRLLRADWLRLEEPDACLAQWDFEALKQHGDFRDNGSGCGATRCINGMRRAW